MDTGIGSSAAAYLNGFPQNSGQGGFQFALNGVVLSWQTLPTPVAGTIIANIKPQIPHNTPVPLSLPVHCLLRTGNFLYNHTLECVHGHNG
jgi:hypothetical protein